MATQPMEINENIHLPQQNYYSWKRGEHKSPKSTDGNMGTSASLRKFKEFLPSKRKKNDDVLFLLYMPP